MCVHVCVFSAPLFVFSSLLPAPATATLTLCDSLLAALKKLRCRLMRIFVGFSLLLASCCCCCWLAACVGFVSVCACAWSVRQNARA